MHTRVSVEIDAPLSAVWAEAIDFASHTEWMSDAADIDFATDQRSGVGTVLLVETRVGLLRTLDRFTITEIVEPSTVRGVHEGPVTGHATWTITESEGRTRFTWEEELRFPWFFGWRLGELVAKPIFLLLWRRNLERLRERVEAGP